MSIDLPNYQDLKHLLGKHTSLVISIFGLQAVIAGMSYKTTLLERFRIDAGHWYSPEDYAAAPFVDLRFTIWLAALTIGCVWFLGSGDQQQQDSENESNEGVNDAAAGVQVIPDEVAQAFNPEQSQEKDTSTRTTHNWKKHHDLPSFLAIGAILALTFLAMLAGTPLSQEGSPSGDTFGVGIDLLIGIPLVALVISTLLWLFAAVPFQWRTYLTGLLIGAAVLVPVWVFLYLPWNSVGTSGAMQFLRQLAGPLLCVELLATAVVVSRPRTSRILVMLTAVAGCILVPWFLANDAANEIEKATESHVLLTTTDESGLKETKIVTSTSRYIFAIEGPTREPVVIPRARFEGLIPKTLLAKKTDEGTPMIRQMVAEALAAQNEAIRKKVAKKLANQDKAVHSTVSKELVDQAQQIQDWVTKTLEPLTPSTTTVQVKLHQDSLDRLTSSQCTDSDSRRNLLQAARIVAEAIAQSRQPSENTLALYSLIYHLAAQQEDRNHGEDKKREAERQHRDEEFVHHISIGYLAYFRKDWKKAESSLNQALRFKPKNPCASILLGLVKHNRDPKLGQQEIESLFTGQQASFKCLQAGIRTEDWAWITSLKRKQEAVDKNR